MSRSTKIWLALAASLIVSGIIIFGVIMSMLKWDITKLGTAKYETNNYGFDESFKNISVNTDTADVIFLRSEDGTCRVVCHENKKAKHATFVSDDTLYINTVDERKWYDHIGIIFDAPEITVYLPLGEYGNLTVNNSTGDVKIPESFSFESIDIQSSTGDVECRADINGGVKITLSTGDVELENISAGKVDISVTTGDIEISALNCDGDIKIKVTTGDTHIENATSKSLISTGSTGDMTLENVVATESFNIERRTGDVVLDGCDASSILVKTSTGNVHGSLLSEKIFVTRTDTGRVSVPKTTSGGTCEINTSTGNIIIKIK